MPGQLRRLQLGEHAARAQAVRRAARGLPQLCGKRSRRHLADQASGRVLARIGGVQPFLVGQQHQQVRLHQVGDLGRQVVVVANADFFGGDGVVFIDNRHHLLLEKGIQGVARVQVARPVGKIGAGEQHLGDAGIVDGEDLLVHSHQARLADRGQHLLGGQVLGQGRKAQHFTPGSHRPGRDQYHLAARGPQRAHLARQVHQAGGGKLFGAPGQGRGANFHHDTLFRRHTASFHATIWGDFSTGWRMLGDGFTRLLIVNEIVKCLFHTRTECL